MANPITWRNVTAPDFSGASRMMDRAGESFSGAFDALQQTKDTYEEGVTDRNTQAFMDELSKYRDPEELAAAREAGTFQQLRSELGANGLIDREKTGIGALDQRLATMQQQSAAQQEYDDMQTQVGNRGLRGEILGLVSNGEVGKAQDLYQQNRDRFTGDSLTSLTNSLNSGYTRQQQQSNADRSFELQQDKFDYQKEQDALELQLQEREMDSEQSEAARGRLEELEEKLNQTKTNELFNMATSPVPEGTTKTQNKQQFTQRLYSSEYNFMDPKEKEQLVKLYDSTSKARRGLADGDKSSMEEGIKGLQTQLQANSFHAVNNSTETPDAIAEKVYSENTDEDGFFLGLANSKNRQEARQKVRNAIMGVDGNGKPFLEGPNGMPQRIPPGYVMNAAKTVLNKRLGFDSLGIDSNFDDQLRNEIQSAGFQHEYGMYDTLQSKVDEYGSQYEAAAFNGGQGGNTGGNNQQNPQGNQDGSGGSRGILGFVGDALKYMQGNASQVQSQDPNGANYVPPQLEGMTEAERQEQEYQSNMQGRYDQPQGTGLPDDPNTPESLQSRQIQSNQPNQQNQSPTSGSGKYPSYEAMQFEDRSEWGTGWDKISGSISNAAKGIVEPLNRNIWETQKETFDSLKELTTKSPTEGNKKKANELYKKFPGVIRHMTKEQQDSLKELIGADKIARTLQRFE